MSNKIYISPDGNDSNTGTEASPLKSLYMALNKIREIKKNNALPDGGISVILREGHYFLDNPLVLDERGSGEKDKPIVFQAYAEEKPIISGGIQLELEWTPYRDGIFQTKVSGNFSNMCFDFALIPYSFAKSKRHRSLIRQWKIAKSGKIPKL
jgi:hypothetical protein